jgi:citronellol/citronellal dehydrogenase
MVRVLITGASRGIGAAVARAFARDGAATAVVARSSLAHTVRAVEAHGGRAIPFRADLRCADEAVGAARAAIGAMGGLDVLVNAASVLCLDRAPPPERMDRMYAVHTRATLLLNQTCRAALEEARGAVVTLSPPVRLGSHDRIAAHPAYTVSKYSTTVATLAFASARVRANCLWPRHAGRRPDDVARAVYGLATSTEWNAEVVYDDEVVDLPPTKAPLSLFALEDVRSLRRG